ncbi:SCP-like protein [Ancylostoma caninum]|uniref:SCP-like protein n=1 Tax=Ancylostoma caninum TaxID=29170 RepID=A0A368FCL6_ANCCA|nr:SCP-like protein [Ancylostoma caninum]
MGTRAVSTYWDCTVENIAHTEAAKCPGTAPNVAGYGVSFDNPNQADLYEAGNANEICASCTRPTDCINALCNEPSPAVVPTGTQCQQNQNTKTLMTDELRDQALNMHNYYRRLLASGWAKDAKLIYAKPSSAMPALTYDCNLENTIMTHLKDCAGTAATTNKAENFVAYGNYQSERADVFSKVVEQWWSPLADIGNENNLYSDSNPAALKTYINMAHKSATSVGCGVQLCPRLGQTLVQCAYEGVPIIADDDPIYPVGKPCSKCKDLPATSKCSALGGLCVA